MNVLPYGDRAVLVELASPAEVLPIRDWLVRQGNPAIGAVTPAARTVLVEFDPARLPAPALRALLDSAALSPEAGSASGDPVLLPVRYDGADLAAVADAAGLTADEVVELHSGAEYTVQFCGFSPGFGYLTGLHERLWLPRLASPRSSVPTGSVAIAGEFTGVYPRSSPGGWRLIGTTDARLFSLSDEPPTRLAPGARVRFVPQ